MMIVPILGTVPNIKSTIAIDAPMKVTAYFLSRTALQMWDDDTGKQEHAALVCVFCDRFIIDTEPFWG